MTDIPDYAEKARTLLKTVTEYVDPADDPYCLNAVIAALQEADKAAFERCKGKALEIAKGEFSPKHIEKEIEELKP